MSISDAVASLGVPVFPIRVVKLPDGNWGKFPAIPKGHGHLDASSDPGDIRRLFGSADANGAGMPTGTTSGICVIDVDTKNGKDGQKWLEEHQEALPQTHTVRTPSDGLHLYFIMPDDVDIRNSTGRETSGVAPGVDVRGNGGWVAIPPSPGYRIADPTPPAEMPRWLIKACLKDERAYLSQTTPAPSANRAGVERYDRYTQAAINGEIGAVCRAPEGTRNDTLNRSAFKLGTLVAAGQMSRSTAEVELQRAAAIAGLPAREALATIKSGIVSGMAHPREMPERSTETRQNSGKTPEIGTFPGENRVDNSGGISPESHALWHSTDEWEEADIPKRPWIVQGYIMRGAVTIIAGAGSVGKSSIVKGWMISLVLNKPYHRFHPASSHVVMTYNVEDDLDEERRRISATLRQFKATPKDLAGKLHIVGPNQVGTLIRKDSDGVFRMCKTMEEMEDLIDRFKLDVLAVDPLVELHNAEENDNTALREVLAFFRQLARRKNIAIIIAHHTRKGTTVPGDADAVRGAGAIVGAARVVFTACVMTEEEADKLGIPASDRKLQFRLDAAKSNYAAQITEAEWFVRCPYMLGNGEEVAAAEPWEPPSPWEGLSWPVIFIILNRVQAGLGNGEFYSAAKQARTRWLGNLLIEHGRRTPDQALQIIKAWLDSGLLQPDEYSSPAQNHGMTGCVRVNIEKFEDMKRGQMEQQNQ